MLPSIVEAVGARTDMFLDGGVRRGVQVVEALGARGVLLGRAYPYGLAAAGEAGVTTVTVQLEREIDVTMAHIDVTSLAGLHERRDELMFRRRQGV